MQPKKSLLMLGVLLAALQGQATPTHQIIHPTADILPALTLNLQGGFADIVGQRGWRPAVRIGLGGAAEFEWSQQYFYSDLEAGKGSVPVAGIKIRLPKAVPWLDWSLAFYNAQKWSPTYSLEYAINESAEYRAANIASVNFESIYSRVDLLLGVQLSEKLRLYPSLYVLDSRARNLRVSFRFFDEEQSASIEIPEIAQEWMVGGGMGFTFQAASDFAYVGQALAAPQYQLDTATNELRLAYRYLIVVGTRYQIGNVIVLDTGIYHDALEILLSKLQVYARLNLVFDLQRVIRRQ